MTQIETVRTDDKRAFHVKEAAKIYGLSRSTLYKQMQTGTLRTVKIGGRRLIPRDAIEALISVDARKGAEARE
ncbi:helix-turn-helix domain-containing protein [Rhodoblastus sp. 17X3]|uniref:helix-turn-helix domain-containing protein n=1 Tax=Rhodoblastus sp. 17X3 TaxID=3047026 RepID=UPI0024B80DCB|nr:helix-turn-helix domain-containing protein [Rhodoblastus sp. 17X3]MDI9848977.1 helix-turn-helix domain-containing protein [Rhodoblastus sp. 17X3]